MPYVPPKYPGEIPTVEDLPDRTDDISWIYAARYNELKKELRAALIELGIDPSGAFDTVRARLDDILPHFHDRGDPAAYDYAVGDFTTDDAWRDLDLSAIVPAGAKAVAIHLLLQDDAVGSRFAFRKNGNTRIRNAARTRTTIANVAFEVDVIVACDTNRVIEYRGSNLTFTSINVVVKGWWK